MTNIPVQSAIYEVVLIVALEWGLGCLMGEHATYRCCVWPATQVVAHCGCTTATSG